MDMRLSILWRQVSLPEGYAPVLPESAHAVFAACEVPYVCGGPVARIAESVHNCAAAALRNAPEGVLLSFHPQVFAASPFLAGSSSAMHILAQMQGAGVGFSNGAVGVVLPKETGRMDFLAGVQAVLSQAGVVLAGESDAFAKLLPNGGVFAAFPPEKQGNFPRFAQPNSIISLFLCPWGENGLPIFPVMREVFAQVSALQSQGKIRSAFALSAGGIGEAIGVMSQNGQIGFALAPAIDVFSIGALRFGGLLLEAEEALPGGVVVGKTIEEQTILLPGCKPMHIKTLYKRKNL